MIYGSLVLPCPPDQAEQEQSFVASMQAALASYPWRAETRRILAGNLAGAFANSSPDPLAEAELLPDLSGLTISADARLDNRAELRAALGQAPAGPEDDARLILLAYQRWGVACPAHLLGDFAFAIWDPSAARLFCARDFAGARPFYYHRDPRSGRLVFASDLLALAAHPAVPLELNLAYIATVLRSPGAQVTHLQQTFYRTIEKLPPAHCLSLEGTQLRSWAFWKPGQAPERRYLDQRDYVEDLLGLLRQAVACRCDSPHPLGAHLSGGLDSSSVAALAWRIRQAQGREFTAFSWAPPLPEDPADLLPNDERKLVEALRAAEGLPLRYTRLSPTQLSAYACRDITLQPTTTLLHELAASSEAAGLGIRTILSGWGGDELIAFNGRGYFSDLLRRGRWPTLWRELSLRARLHGGAAWKELLIDGVMPLLPLAVLKALTPLDIPGPQPLPDCLRPGFTAALAGVEPLRRSEGRERPGVRRMQIDLLQNGHLSYRMESWASHGASLGITYAYPLLDQRLVEFALSIPDYLFFQNGWKRYLYRVALEGILPDSLRWNKKKEDPAMQQGARKIIGAQLQDSALQARADNPYLDVEKLQTLLTADLARPEPPQPTPLSRRQQRLLKLAPNPRRARWLAFINPKATLPA